MASAARLYSGEVLALATSLANWPLTADLPLTGSARSPACGSTLTVGLDLDPAGQIARIGIKAQACAIGQAAAAIFAAAAPGADRVGVAAALAALERWLVASGALPDWPGLAAIAPARDFPGRHGAMLLPWRAALEALPTA
ncbi:iron-sulfur cluster assembly scaffold protein [Novosphingobium sp.]|uniref:iron-sulfur cluster assembly scaffold protein n=1 Tax=Novosphingobium sp. TaxID=1874826 RepID=UPI0027323E2F|nr:iron-sulfur cluster assembly scaffold protein [Novosphingobium sp.]MDP3905678.1 iron-sulfur cluster assembly scaffold protein [Novosphingobium sp.]